MSGLGDDEGIRMRVHRVVRSNVVLSLAEVRESGRPAFFFDYGEALVYESDELYDVYDWGTALQTKANPLPLPHDVLEHGVGIEYGWRHAVSCDCDRCTLRRTATSAGRAASTGDRLPASEPRLPATVSRELAGPGRQVA